jgi:hypothetical protein
MFISIIQLVRVLQLFNTNDKGIVWVCACVWSQQEESMIINVKWTLRNGNCSIFCACVCVCQLTGNCLSVHLRKVKRRGYWTPQFSAAPKTVPVIYVCTHSQLCDEQTNRAFLSHASNSIFVKVHILYAHAHIVERSSIYKKRQRMCCHNFVCECIRKISTLMKLWLHHIYHSQVSIVSYDTTCVF